MSKITYSIEVRYMIYNLSYCRRFRAYCSYRRWYMATIEGNYPDWVYNISSGIITVFSIFCMADNAHKGNI